MPTYIRNRIAGESYFFTVNLGDQGRGLLDQRIDVVRAAYVEMARLRPVQCDAMVILPDHIHAVWTLPDGDDDHAVRWAHFKSIIANRLFPEASFKAVGGGRRGPGVWRRRYWAFRIPNPEEFARHVEYCWHDPVAHGLVARVADWPYSTFHRDVRNGVVGSDWRGRLQAGRFGERSDHGESPTMGELFEGVESRKP